MTKKQEKAAAIAACQDSKGRIKPAAVVEAAKNPKNVLHKEFEWDVKKAAYKDWLNTAKALIREVRIEITYEEVKHIIPYYVSDVTTKDTNYVATTAVKKRKNVAKATLIDEIARIKSAIKRSSALTTFFFGLEKRFDDMMEIAIEIENELE